MADLLALTLILAGDQRLSLSLNRSPFAAPADRFEPLATRNILHGNFSKEAISWANKCIDLCDQEHPICPSSSGLARLPTRVLDLEMGLSHNSVRLVDMQGKSGRYICLSHCWGKSRNKCLTTKAVWKPTRPRSQSINYLRRCRMP